MLFNPIVAVLHNEKTDRYHPILFQENPLPGPPSNDKPVRHKSFGHHTDGFDTRQEALNDIETSESIRSQCPNIKKCIGEDMPWDGDGIPAIVGFFSEDGTKLLM